MRLLVAQLLAVAALGLGGCVADEGAHPAHGCDSDADCADDRVCYRGFCVVDDPEDAGEIDAGRRDAGGADAGGRDAGPLDAGSLDAGPVDAGSVECTAGATESCYTGPSGTEGVGLCAAGERTCEGGTWGACTGETTPAAEECNAADDDCDGSTDEDFPFDTDEANCGGCGMACSSGEECCSGGCVDTTGDPSNCGGCGTGCRPPTRSCCSGTCAMSC